MTATLKLDSLITALKESIDVSERALVTLNDPAFLDVDTLELQLTADLHFKKMVLSVLTAGIVCLCQ